jgi:DNA adenine methylase (dam)
MSVCSAVLKTGDRKGLMCGKPSKHGSYCGVHKNLGGITEDKDSSLSEANAQAANSSGTRKAWIHLQQRLKPLFKWSGGKSDEIQTFLPYIPEEFRGPCSVERGLYLEPFVGGGALFFFLMPLLLQSRDCPTENATEHVMVRGAEASGGMQLHGTDEGGRIVKSSERLDHKIAVIGDIHPEMIAFYKAIGEGKAQDIHRFMVAHPNEEAVYYDVRDRLEHEDPFILGCRFYYLRKTCFRGMSRYNKSGHFNIPFGRYESINYDDLLDKKYEELLQKTDILHTSFETFFERYNDERNFMFLDPPYDSTFTDYGYCEFSREQHRKLAELFRTTKIRCLMIIAKTDFIAELYKDFIVGEYDKKYRFKIHSGRVGDEIDKSHLVIKNYH